MDDFEKNYPDFDWKNTPTKDHPQGVDCPCPRHEFIRETANVAVQTHNPIVMKMCPDHYRVYFEEIYPKLPAMVRFLQNLLRKLNIIQIKEIPYMQSDQCYYCKFGGGGNRKAPELPPVS